MGRSYPHSWGTAPNDSPTHRFRGRIPATLFRVTLGTYYSYGDREFAQKIEKCDKSLLGSFLLGDYNRLCTYPYATTGHIKSFIRVKYGMGPRRLTRLLGTEIAFQALTSPEIKAKRDALMIVRISHPN